MNKSPSNSDTFGTSRTGHERRMKIKKSASMALMLEMLKKSDGAADEEVATHEWEQADRVHRDWAEVEPAPSDLAINPCRDMIAPLCKTKFGYRLELGRNSVPYCTPQVECEDTDKDFPFFEQKLFKKGHINCLAEADSLGPVIVSIEHHTPGRRTKVMVRTKYGTTRMYVPAQYTVIKDIIKFVKNNHPRLKALGGELKTFPIWDEKVSKELATDLLAIERMEIVSKYKIGVLFVKEGQTDENVIYSNVDGSGEFYEFLNVLAAEVGLKGFTGYAGGLDTKSNSTGASSYHTIFRNYEIMFHVSTLLPFQPDDLQRVERKRHIGNDVVVIIYKEGSQPFDPLCITSQFNHNFIVVQSCDAEGRMHDGHAPTHFAIVCANKPGVEPYGPFLLNPPIFDRRSPELRKWLLSKLINAERGSMYSPEFKGKQVTVRRTQLESLFDKYMAMARQAKRRLSSQLPTAQRKKSADDGPAVKEQASGGISLSWFRTAKDELVSGFSSLTGSRGSPSNTVAARRSETATPPSSDFIPTISSPSPPALAVTPASPAPVHGAGTPTVPVGIPGARDAPAGSPIVLSASQGSRGLAHHRSISADMDVSLLGASVIELGKKVLACCSVLDPQQFDSALLRSLLQQVFQWTLEDEASTFGKYSYVIIENARKLLKAGNAYADLQESRRFVQMDEAAVTQLVDQMREALRVFFSSLREARLSSGLPLPPSGTALLSSSAPSVIGTSPLASPPTPRRFQRSHSDRSNSDSPSATSGQADEAGLLRASTPSEKMGGRSMSHDFGRRLSLVDRAAVAAAAAAAGGSLLVSTPDLSLPHPRSPSPSDDEEPPLPPLPALSPVVSPTAAGAVGSMRPVSPLPSGHRLSLSAGSPLLPSPQDQPLGGRSRRASTLPSNAGASSPSASPGVLGGGVSAAAGRVAGHARSLSSVSSSAGSSPGSAAGDLAPDFRASSPGSLTSSATSVSSLPDAQFDDLLDPKGILPTLDILMGQVKQLVLQLARCLQATEFVERTFIDTLRHLGKVLKELTDIIEPRLSSRLLSSATVLLQEGMVLRKEKAKFDEKKNSFLARLRETFLVLNDSYRRQVEILSAARLDLLQSSGGESPAPATPRKSSV